MPEPLLALEAVSLHSPEGRPVFRDLTWRLQRGAKLQLRGALGGGATAFLRLCAGLAHPESGSVLLEGAPVDPAAGLNPFLEAGGLGWVPSDGGLLVNLSLLDNVALPLRFALNQGGDRARAVAQEWLDRAGLGAAAGQRPHVPGDGQAWLASLARAAAKGSRLWLVDRPAGSLDAPALRAAQELLAQAAQDPAVTLVVLSGPWIAAGEPLFIEAGRVSERSEA